MKIACFLALLVVCILDFAPLSSQTLDSAKTDTVPKERENWYWAHGGAGLGFYAINNNNSRAFVLELGLSVAYKSTLFTLQTNSVYDVALFWHSSVNSYGGMGGWIVRRDDYSFASVSVGLSYVEYSIRVPGTGLFSGRPAQYDITPGVGLIAEAQVGIHAYVPGVSLKILGNLNNIRPFITGTVVVHLGWIP